MNSEHQSHFGGKILSVGPSWPVGGPGGVIGCGVDGGGPGGPLVGCQRLWPGAPRKKLIE